MALDCTWPNPMGARLWKCSREQMRIATDEESLSKEVAMALSKEVLEDVESGRTARFVDVTSDGGPPAEELLERLAPAVPEPIAIESPPGPAQPEMSRGPEPSAPAAPVSLTSGRSIVAILRRRTAHPSSPRSFGTSNSPSRRS